MSATHPLKRWRTIVTDRVSNLRFRESTVEAVAIHDTKVAILRSHRKLIRKYPLTHPFRSNQPARAGPTLDPKVNGIPALHPDSGGHRQWQTGTYAAQ